MNAGRNAFAVGKDVMYDHIAVDQPVTGVARIRLDRPERMNALGIGPGSNRAEIAAAMSAADKDESIGCILLTAAGAAFCAGGDLSGVAPAETPVDDYAFVAELGAFYEQLRAVRTPIVGAVQGLCLGAGMSLAAQCDLLVAADDARFGLVEGRMGHPGATEIAPIVGAAWAKFLILTGELIDAHRAERIGFVLSVVPAADLEGRALDLARRVAAVPRASALMNKAAVDAMADALGRQDARRVGRAHDVTTKAAARQATAPDGRLFDDILREEGTAGLKKARDSQFTGRWLAAGGPTAP
ncbi:MAG: enoyl-CoA hydratase [Frankiales bacterium]|nr:enoyl-CoA hydratase [Frankiales bacterium]